MSGATFHESASDLQVIGLRPGDKVLLRATVPITAEDAQHISARMAAQLGESWGVVVSDTLDIIVIRREDEGTVPE